MSYAVATPRLFLGIALATLCAAPVAHAQQFVATVAAACGTVGVGGQLSVPTTAAVAVGDAIVVAVASGSNAAADIQVSDTRGSAYRPFGTERADVRHFAAVNLVARVETALSAGDSIAVRVGQPAPAQEICVQASVFRGLVSGIEALDTHGGTENTGTTLGVSAPGGRFAGMLNFASIAYSGDAGSITTSGANIALPRVCSAGNALCLVAAYATGSAAGPQNVTVVASNPVPWAGSLSSLYAVANLAVFSNGFE